MPKRQRDDDSDAEEDEAVETSDESEDEKPLKPKRKAKPKTIKKPSFDDAEESDDEEDHEQSAKRSKPTSRARNSASTSEEADVIQTDSSGDKYIDLGKKRRATVRTFKGTAFVDIREFYDAGGEEKPGKKGIALSPEQWEVLKTNADAIDSMFAGVQKRKK